MEQLANLIEPEAADLAETLAEETALAETIEELLATAEPETTGDEVGTDVIDGSERSDDPKRCARVFISHRRNFEPDQNIASLLSRELKDDFDVYLDTERPAIERYNEAISDAIDNADVVIALISSQANQSDADWIMAELERAYRHWHDYGKPGLLSINLEPISEYQPRIAACLSGFNRIDYSGDNAYLVEQVRAAINAVPAPQPPSAVGLEGFLVSNSQIKLMSAALSGSDELAAPSRSLQRDKLIWIEGDASVRNYVALSLAVENQTVNLPEETQEVRKIYEITKSLRWSKVHNTLIRNSILIFVDVVPGALFDDDLQGMELRSLDLLINRNNLIIVTTSRDSYPEIEQEMRKRESKHGEKIEIGSDFYNKQAKLTIFDKLLAFSEQKGEISSRQREWTYKTEVRESLDAIIEKWSPADIERFITWHLRKVKRPGDIRSLLQRNADLDNEIHSWFVSLDDSIRCFVMVLALFSELSQEELWGKYKAVIQRLRKLDADLALWPLGICRERASLYVTTEGAVDFTEERIASAIYREIAKNYREYFIELLPLMESWSVPEGRNAGRADAISEARKRRAADSQDVRAAIAHMVGKVGQYGLADLTNLLNRWATDPLMTIREAVAQALDQAVSEGFETKPVFTMLDSWTKDRSTGDDALTRTWSAASALGTIAVSKLGQQISKDALHRLEKLARDSRPSIRFYVSIPLKRAARKVPLTDEIENLLALLVQDDSASTKINVAEALNEARVFNGEAALRVINRWLFSNDKNQRWAAASSLIIWSVWHQRTEETYQEIIRLLRQDSEILTSVFVEITNHKIHKKGALSLFRQVVQRTPDNARPELIVGLAKIPFGLLDERLLVRFRTSTQPALQTLAADVRTERWNELMAAPNKLIADLLDELENEQMWPELYLALAPLVTPESEGSRPQLVAALADAFVENRAGLDKVLAKLKKLAPSTFEPLVVEVRSGVFERLFYDPVKFVNTVTAYLHSPQTTEETTEGLDRLAHPWPKDSREELLQALAAAYALEPPLVRELLKLFRTSSTNHLCFIPHEFNRRLVEGLLSNPTEFLSKIMSAMHDPGEFEEFVYILQELGVSEPTGKRRMLIAALAEARTINSVQVDQLLQHPSVVAQLSLVGLKLEVRRASRLHNLFVPKVFRELFTPVR